MAQELLKMATDIVAAYVGNNKVRSEDLPGIIRSLHTALKDADQGGTAASENLKPAVSIKKSVTPEFIICLEDGRKLKMLKRHLRTTYGMTPEEYRAKWGLPVDYPMVAPNYAKKRSEFAKKIGLGQKSTGKKRGRPKGSKNKK